MGFAGARDGPGACGRGQPCTPRGNSWVLPLFRPDRALRSWVPRGVMEAEDWLRVMREATEIGVRTVVFIGGVPLLHPLLPRFMEYALELGLLVRVVSNFVHVPERLWQLFRVFVSVSYYSAEPGPHDAMTRRRGSHRRMSANLRKAAGLGVRLAGLVMTTESAPDPEPARAALRSLGVRNDKVAPLQAVGRAAGGRVSTVADLCGRCSGELLAVTPIGDVFPCTMARWLPVGNVRGASLREIVGGGRVGEVRAGIQAALSERELSVDCNSSGTDGGCMP
ncbi:radical SAM/SPASM domain-containing protein [Streptomyces gamaensis]|uniref:Radical SAM/SPASM domain-containing protein n=1 Tax=Streptomyces gamaensis TaxID=1763542 RepID=A0ABW0YVQ0_9ACTN